MNPQFYSPMFQHQCQAQQNNSRGVGPPNDVLLNQILQSQEALMSRYFNNQKKLTQYLNQRALFTQSLGQTFSEPISNERSSSQNSSSSSSYFFSSNDDSSNSSSSVEQISKQENKQRNELANMKKLKRNICKYRSKVLNWGKEVLTFINKKEKLLQQVLNIHGIDQSSFREQLNIYLMKKQTIRIEELWCDNPFHKIFRILSNYYLKRYSLPQIQKNKLYNSLNQRQKVLLNIKNLNLIQKRKK